MLPTYQPTERTSPHLLWVLPGAIIAMILLGRMYSSIMASFNGWIGDLFVVALTLLACGLLSRLTIRWGHVRHSRLGTAIALLLALAFLWARWQLTMERYWPEPSFLERLLHNPLDWLGQWRALAESKDPPSYERKAAWLAEMLLVLLSNWLGATLMSSTPYSERSHAWASKSFDSALEPTQRIANADALRDALQRVGVDALLSCPVNQTQATFSPGSPSVEDITITGYTVSGDPWGCWLSVSWRTRSFRAGSDVSTQQNFIVQHWIVHQSEYSRVQAHLL